MKTHIFCYCIIAVITFCLCCCGKPSPNTPIINGLEQSDNFIDLANTFSGNTDSLKKFMFGLLQNSKAVFHFKENATVKVETYYDMTGDLFFSLDKNRYYLVRGFYITFVDKDTYLSLDGKRWVAFYANPMKNKRDIKYFEGKYHLEHRYDASSDTLNVRITMGVNIFDEENIPYCKETFDRPVISLADITSDTFYVQKDKDIENKLLDKVLYVPSGTICNLRGSIDGNLINAAMDDVSQAKFARDIYLYSKVLPSMSFDNKNWSINLMNLKIHTATNVSTSGNKIVDYWFKWQWDYK